MHRNICLFSNCQFHLTLPGPWRREMGICSPHLQPLAPGLFSHGQLCPSLAVALSKSLCCQFPGESPSPHHPSSETHPLPPTSRPPALQVCVPPEHLQPPTSGCHVSLRLPLLPAKAQGSATNCKTNPALLCSLLSWGRSPSPRGPQGPAHLSQPRPTLPSFLSAPRSLCSGHRGLLDVPLTRQPRSCPRAFAPTLFTLFF